MDKKNIFLDSEAKNKALKKQKGETANVFKTEKEITVDLGGGAKIYLPPKAVELLRGKPGQKGIGVKKFYRKNDMLYCIYTNDTEECVCSLKDGEDGGGIDRISMQKNKLSITYNYGKETFESEIKVPAPIKGDRGAGIDNISMSDNTLRINYDDNKKNFTGKINVPKGKDGVGVKSIKAKDNKLIFTLTNNEKIEVDLPELEKEEGIKSSGGGYASAYASTKAFSTVKVSGQNDVVANNAFSDLTFIAGTNITLTTDATNDTVTITASGGGGSGDMTKAVYDPANIGEQLLGITASQTVTNKGIDADNNTITNIGLAEFDTDTADSFDVIVGAALDSPVVTISESGGTVSLELEKSGGGDIRFVFTDGVHTHDCTPADTVALTNGSDISPTLNYVYIPQSTKTLTASTTGFPSAEHAPIATVMVQSAASVALYGAYKVHAWTDHVLGSSDSNGHLAHLNYWIRSQPATWLSGVALTPTVGAGTFDIATSAGNILQLHQHSFPAFDTSTGSDVYVINDPTTNYLRLGDLTGITQDINGNDLTTAAYNFYNLVVWGVVNEESGDCKLFINEPDGAYNNNNGNKATNDDDNTAVYDIPSEYTGVGFLIARLTVDYNGGTYLILQNEDLRGQFPSTSAGGGAVGGNEFIDNVFRIQDDGDTTKQIAFQASGITTATTRTITMTDADVNLDIAKSSIGSAADRFAYTTGANTWTEGTITAAGRAILDDANAAAQRTTLGAAATSHTHAASDITSGTLTHERGGLEADVSAGDGFVQIKSGSTTVIKSNLSASTDPGINDDSSAGYSVGSDWINTTGDKSFVCVDASVGAAVWKETSAGAGGGISNVVDDTTPQLGGMLDVNGQAIGDGTLELLTFTEDASAVNHINIENEATGAGPIISSTGDDTNVDLNISTKGSGEIKINSTLNCNGQNLTDVHEVRIDAVPDTDHTANGPTTDSIQAGTTVAIGELCYLNASGQWALADADAEATAAGMLAISLEAQTVNNAMKVALPGSFVRDDTWAWTTGNVLYVSTTAGDLTATAPSATGDVVRVVGYAISADVVYFFPSGAWVEVA
jgi:hypothetical protein